MLWEGRHKSSPVQSDLSLMVCIRYIELNPVRARMVAEPEEYIGSSARRWCAGTNLYPWLDDVPFPPEFGSSADPQANAYLRFIRETIPEGERAHIRESVTRGQLTGDNRFVDEVQRLLGKRIEHRRQGGSYSKIELFPFVQNINEKNVSI